MTYVAASKAFAHMDRLAAWQRGERAAPVTVEWDLSNRCPLGCFACHFAHTHTHGPWTTRERSLPMAFENTGDLADIELVARGVREMEAHGVQAVVWSGGGEPTAHPQWMTAMRHAAAAGLQQGMYTAGMLLSAETARELSEYATWVVVSLDAPDRETYRVEKQTDAFDAACAGVRHLAAEGGAVVGVSFLLHHANWSHADDMLALARRLGADYTTFRPVIITDPAAPSMPFEDRGWITDAMPTLLALAREPDVECAPDRFGMYRDWTGRSYRTCHGIKLNTTVTPDGRVWVCMQRRGVAGSEVGDLRVESFSELWSRHVGAWTDFTHCRAMCRLHLVNEALADVFEPHAHEAFI